MGKENDNRDGLDRVSTATSCKTLYATVRSPCAARSDSNALSRQVCDPIQRHLCDGKVPTPYQASLNLKYRCIQEGSYPSIGEFDFPLWPSSPVFSDSRENLYSTSSTSTFTSSDSSAHPSSGGRSVSETSSSRAHLSPQTLIGSNLNASSNNSWLCRYCRTWTSAPLASCSRCQRARYEQDFTLSQFALNILKRKKAIKLRWECPHCQHRNPRWTETCINCLWEPDVDVSEDSIVPDQEAEQVNQTAVQEQAQKTAADGRNSLQMLLKHVTQEQSDSTRNGPKQAGPILFQKNCKSVVFYLAAVLAQSESSPLVVAS